MGNRIEPGESEDDSDCSDELRDYPTPQSLDEQANTGQNSQNEDISSKSNQVATPSETSSEPEAPTSFPEPPIEPSRSETPSFEPS